MTSQHVSNLGTYLLIAWIFVSPDFMFAATLIDSKPVTNGASVVLERIDDDGSASYYQYSYRTSTGIDWAFYQEPEVVKTLDGHIISDITGKITELPVLEFNDSRVAFLLMDGINGKIVTLDTDPSFPLMHEDVFVDAFGLTFNGISLKSVNSLVVVVPEFPGDKPKTLTRGKDGVWLHEGKPYTWRLRSTSLKVPLPKMSELPVNGQSKGLKIENTSQPKLDGRPQVKALPEQLEGEEGRFSLHWTWMLGGVITLALLGWRKLRRLQRHTL